MGVLKQPEERSETQTMMSGKPELEDVLTPREMEITRLAAQGLTNKEIALALEISHWTVATHLRRIFEKAQVRRRAALSLALAGRSVGALRRLRTA